MKLSRLLTIIILVTVSSLLYVWQQTEVFHLAYIGQKNLALFDDLLDKNSLLRYNIGKHTSLVCIGDKVLQKDSDFRMPDYYRLVRLAPPKKSSLASRRSARKESVFARIFGIKRQAEAKTITPSQSR